VTLTDFGYSKTEFSLAAKIISGIIPNLDLSVEQVLSPPSVENIVAQSKFQQQQILMQAQQRAKLMADKLRELGIDPESLS
jgi:hypothetical protein